MPSLIGTRSEQVPTNGMLGTSAFIDAPALPVSDATAAILNTKVDKVAGKGLSTEDYTTAEKTKLAGVAAGATANSTDAQLRDRATHTGIQAISTVSGLQAALDGKAAAIHGHTIADVSGLQTALDGTVKTTGNQTVGGSKTFSSRVNGKTSGTDATAAFFAAATGGSYASMWARRGSPFHSSAATTGSSYAAVLSQEYVHNSAYSGVYSVGVLNLDAASAGAFAIHHLNSNGTQDMVWLFYGTSGDFVSPGNVAAYSDIRLKTDLTKISDALAKVNQLNGYTYTRKDTGQRQTGVVAQEVQKVLPEAVIDNGEHLSVAYGNMVGLLIEAIKELKSEVDQLKGK